MAKFLYLSRCKNIINKINLMVGQSKQCIIKQGKHERINYLLLREIRKSITIYSTFCNFRKYKLENKYYGEYSYIKYMIYFYNKNKNPAIYFRPRYPNFY